MCPSLNENKYFSQILLIALEKKALTITAFYPNFFSIFYRHDFQINPGKKISQEQPTEVDMRGKKKKLKKIHYHPQ